MRIRPSISALLLVLATACASPSHQLVPMPAADSEVGPEISRVYVVREKLFVGWLKDVRLFDGELEIGALRAGRYLCWDRPAERGVGVARFQGYELDGQEVESVFDLPRTGGTTTWLSIRLRQGDRKPIVETVPAAEGQALVAEREPAPIP